MFRDGHRTATLHRGMNAHLFPLGAKTAQHLLQGANVGHYPKLKAPTSLSIQRAKRNQHPLSFSLANSPFPTGFPPVQAAQVQHETISSSAQNGVVSHAVEPPVRRLMRCFDYKLFWTDIFSLRRHINNCTDTRLHFHARCQQSFSSD